MVGETVVYTRTPVASSYAVRESTTWVTSYMYRTAVICVVNVVGSYRLSVVTASLAVAGPGFDQASYVVAMAP